MLMRLLLDCLLYAMGCTASYDCCCCAGGGGGLGLLGGLVVHLQSRAFGKLNELLTFQRRDDDDDARKCVKGTLWVDGGGDARTKKI